MFLQRIVYAAMQAVADSLRAAVNGHRAAARSVRTGAFLSRASVLAPVRVA